MQQPLDDLMELLDDEDVEYGDPPADLQATADAFSIAGLSPAYTRAGIDISELLAA